MAVVEVEVKALSDPKIFSMETALNSKQAELICNRAICIGTDLLIRNDSCLMLRNVQ